MNAAKWLTMAAGVLLIASAALQARDDWRAGTIVALFGVVNILVATA